MSNILIALEISALGMGLVFAAIVLLWWMMAVLTNLMVEKDSLSATDSDSPSAEARSIADRDLKAQAAAVAVAIALADYHASHAHPLSPPPTALVSAWQLGMRTKQLYQKGTPVRPPHKVGQNEVHGKSRR